MKKMLLAASALLGAALSQTSCQAPARPAPKSEPIAATDATVHVVRRPAPAKQTPLQTAQRKVVVRQAPLFPAGFTHFIEKPHRRKVKYGRSKWIIL